MNRDLDVVAGVEDVLADVALGVGVLDRARQNLVRLEELASTIDVDVLGADRVGANQAASMS